MPSKIYSMNSTYTQASPIFHTILLMTTKFSRVPFMFSTNISLSSPIQTYIVPIIISLLISFPCLAEENSQFHLDATQNIVYCDITPSFNQNDVIQRLNDGTEVFFYWHIEVESIQNYWLNQQVADIHFNRQVLPDLLTQQWQLHDSLTDIPSHTHSLSQALAFLSQIKHFPIIDKNLLSPHTAYLITVSLNIEEGKQNHTWWNAILHTEYTIASSILNLP